MDAPKDYYKILEVNDKADAKEIKASYRRLARKYHPDIGGKASENRFKEINEAYEVLSDPDKKQKYDAMRKGYAQYQAHGQGPGYQRVSYSWNPESAPGTEWGDIFGDIFSGMGSRQRTSAEAGTGRRQSTVPLQTVTITLEQVASGTTASLTVNEPQICPICHGTDPDCSRCGGLGQVMMPHKFSVTIPPGVRDGAILRVGEHARIKVQVAPHARFVRQGDDLIGRLMVAVPVAATGGELNITPLAGSQVSVKIPAHTNQGKMLRLRGLGLPRMGTDQNGDML
ncbi:MAG: J domain-containing protein, partial [Sulfobacillus thermotolerans]|nr:J domain-containing protein [Sulfobacillus thermotolerans]